MNNFWALTEYERFRLALSEGVRTETDYIAWLDTKRMACLQGIKEQTESDALQRKQTFTKHNWNQLTRACDNCGMKLVDFYAECASIPCNAKS